MKNSFSYSDATLSNSLPGNIRESASLNQFKRRLLYLAYFLKTQHSWKSGLYGILLKVTMIRILEFWF